MRCNTICLVSWGPYQWIFPLPKKRGVLCNEHRRLVYYDLAIKISFSSPNCWQKGPVRKAIRIPSARCLLVMVPGYYTRKNSVKTHKFMILCVFTEFLIDLEICVLSAT